MKQAERGCGVGRRAVQPRKYWTDLECLDTSPRLYFHWMVRGASGAGAGGGEEQTRERESEAERERGAPRVDLAFFCLAFSGCWQLLAIVDKKKTRCRVRLF